MSQKESPVICDGCGSDISTTGNCVDYRLVLQNEPLPSWGGVVTSMMIYPIIKEPKHFCGLDCLKNWVLYRSTDTEEKG